ncbi:hypothetical protein GXM_05526 [Nostoc sphaeroides CCNUC1]|uniref:Uncharacterized protein n=1 Tax=Nostoc sphaeroides CCNUC1 TaxID=2653204 RepID=A0A5P8W5W0_9NOSO|nr:hypothetical protein GXM_05526 [Nostoc sphaeroides CCNUC1]
MEVRKSELVLVTSIILVEICTTADFGWAQHLTVHFQESIAQSL